MRNSAIGLLPLLATLASAAPAASPSSVFSLERREGSDDGAVCKADLTKQRWVDGKYDAELQNYLATGPSGGGWSTDGPMDRSALQVVRSYASTVDDYSCTPLDASNAHCTSQDLGSEENCAVHEGDVTNSPKAVIILKAIANFANYMVSVGTQAAKAADEVRGIEGDLTDKFAIDKSANGIFGNSGPYIIASAIIGAIPAIGGIGGGLFGLLIGVNSLTAGSDGKWEASMAFNEYVQSISTKLSSAAAEIADKAINTAPGVSGKDKIDDYARHDPSSLPQLLADGTFADASSATVTEDNKKTIKDVITSAAINSLMINSGVFVARVNPKETFPDDNSDACGPETDSIPYDAGVKYCDSEGFMYVLQRWDGRDVTVKGFEKLGDYGLDYKTVIQRSWDWQVRFGMGHEFSDASLDMIKDNIGDGQNLDVQKLQLWTLPVCDFDASSESKEDADAANLTYQCDVQETQASCLFKTQLYWRCPGVKDWPLGPVPNLDDTPPAPN